MRCPECIGSLRAFTTHDVKLDRCDTCGALWFDRSELEAYLSRHPRWKREHTISHDDLRHSTRGTERKCPRCKTRTLLLGNYRGAGFRKCKSCHGVLLDKKNLNFIMGGKTGGSKYPFFDAGFLVLDGLATADAFAALLEFVLDIVGGALSA